MKRVIFATIAVALALLCLIATPIITHMILDKTGNTSANLKAVTFGIEPGMHIKPAQGLIPTTIITEINNEPSAMVFSLTDNSTVVIRYENDIVKQIDRDWIDIPSPSLETLTCPTSPEKVYRGQIRWDFVCKEGYVVTVLLQGGSPIQKVYMVSRILNSQ